MLILLLGVLAGCAGFGSRRRAPEETWLAAPEVRLPSRFVRGYFLVELELEGRPCMFLLDTGASRLVLDDEVAADLSAELRAVDGRVVGAEGAEVPFRHMLAIDRLTSRDVVFRHLDAMVLDLDDVAESLGEPLDGVLGYPVFGSCLLTLDYGRREVRLARGSLPRDAASGVLRLEDGHVPYLQVTAGGLPFEALLDSGSNESLALPADTDGLRFSGTVATSVGAVTIGGSSHISPVTRLKGDLCMGPYVVRNPTVNITRGGPRIGHLILRHFEVTFDAAASRVRLLPVQEAVRRWVHTLPACVAPCTCGSL